MTANLKDFPIDRLTSGLQVLSAAEFAYHTVSLNPVRALGAVRQIAQRSGRKAPARSVEDILSVLVERYGLSEAVDILQQVSNG